MAQDAMTLIATDKELTGQVLRVFFYMAGRLDFENYIRIVQTEIVEALGIYKPDVSKAIKLLESKNILLRGPKIGQSYSWRLNPNFGYKSDPRGKVYRVGNELVFRVLEGGKGGSKGNNNNKKNQELEPTPEIDQPE